ncbi:hypothetical protein SDC9_188570 [bioreactor metagenome]|uniref:Uncharacterized protein n=1 Tax=bioreactor metagenome TaxID=1076179 RepID=A0A645HQA2_9ZZZZ
MQRFVDGTQVFTDYGSLAAPCSDIEDGPGNVDDLLVDVGDGENACEKRSA